MREHDPRVRAERPESVLNELRAQLAASAAGLLVTCAGNSMAPTVRRGDQVRVRRGPIEPGDVFLFETSTGTLELHRLIAVLPRGRLVHRGDAGGRFGFTSRAKVIGRAEVPRRAPTRLELARAMAAVAREGMRRTARALRSARRAR